MNVGGLGRLGQRLAGAEQGLDVDAVVDGVLVVVIVLFSSLGWVLQLDVCVNLLPALRQPSKCSVV